MPIYNPPPTAQVKKALFACAQTHRHMLMALEILRDKVDADDNELRETLDLAVKSWEDELTALEALVP